MHNHEESKNQTGGKPKAAIVGSSSSLVGAHALSCWLNGFCDMVSARFKPADGHRSILISGDG